MLRRSFVVSSAAQFVCLHCARAQWPGEKKEPGAANWPVEKKAPDGGSGISWPTDQGTTPDAGADKQSRPISKKGKLRLEGCQLSAKDSNDLGGRFLKSSGNTIIDGLIYSEANLLAAAFQIVPGFAFYDDSSEGGNAFATRDALLGQSAGTVGLGITLLKDNLQRTGPTAVAGIMAHEWGHVVQFAAGTLAATILKEIQADYMAGWYIAQRQRGGAATNIQQLASALFTMGDYSFNSPNTHGTPPQRVNSMGRGFSAGLQGVPMQQAFSMSTL